MSRRPHYSDTNISCHKNCAQTPMSPLPQLPRVVWSFPRQLQSQKVKPREANSKVHKHWVKEDIFWPKDITRSLCSHIKVTEMVFMSTKKYALFYFSPNTESCLTPFHIPTSESDVATEKLDPPGEKSQCTGDVKWHGRVTPVLGSRWEQWKPWWAGQFLSQPLLETPGRGCQI